MFLNGTCHLQHFCVLTKLYLSYFDVAQSKVKYHSTHANECGLSGPICLVVHLYGESMIDILLNSVF